MTPSCEMQSAMTLEGYCIKFALSVRHLPAVNLSKAVEVFDARTLPFEDDQSQKPKQRNTMVLSDS
ncbi:hypothetical protein LB504_009376 [Fusarium proliferatum]|nr:hypothetical protein LB504_009376 [Fusarium proliferatum]